jgi:hypothetical protein
MNKPEPPAPPPCRIIKEDAPPLAAPLIYAGLIIIVILAIGISLKHLT